MHRLILAFAAVTLATAPAYAANRPCHNPKTGKFMPCPKPTPAAGVVKDKNGKCHVASGKDKGKFTKCP
jgi:hypothetical protein